jgi:hypothetical protein
MLFSLIWMNRKLGRKKYTKLLKHKFITLQLILNSNLKYNRVDYVLII